MRIKSFQSALACFSTSLLLAGAALAEASDRTLELRFAELELEHKLAKEGDLYFRLDAGQPRLQVRARGLTLKEVPLSQLFLLVFQPLFGGTSPPSLPSPSVWTITNGPGDTDRETIAPTELRPYSEEEPEPKPPSPTATPIPKVDDEPQRPARYRVALDNGWQLLLTPRPPRSNFFSRFWASARDGWSRARGEQLEHPPLFVLVLEAEDARSLHHLFRTGRKILLASPVRPSETLPETSEQPAGPSGR